MPGAATSPSADSETTYGTRSKGRSNRVTYHDSSDEEMGNTTTPRTTTTGTGTKRRQSKGAQVEGSPASVAGSSSAIGTPATEKERKKSKGTPKIGKEKEGQEKAIPRLSLKIVGNGLRQKKETPGAKYKPARSMVSKEGVESLTLEDGTVLTANDSIYLISEPPGEPYYIARIMEFIHESSASSTPAPETDTPKTKRAKKTAEPASNGSTITSVRVNWFYRPKDVLKQVSDSRILFATMHSDVCPVNAIRGKCTAKHRAHIDNLDEYRKIPDSFWYEKLFDRYIHRYYEVVPTEKVLNVPAKVKEVLREQWAFVVVEGGRGKELCMEERGCTKCSGWCASSDSVRCALCHADYHMACVSPPLTRKPGRGFGWTCAPCTRAEEKKMEENAVPEVSKGRPLREGEADKLEVQKAARANLLKEDDLISRPTTSATTSTSVQDGDSGTLAKVEEIMEVTGKNVGRSKDKKHEADLWPYRYLGIHCNVEDVLDYDDRLYPRAASRVGGKHQAVVLDWPGRPFELIDVKKEVLTKKQKQAAYQQRRKERDAERAAERKKLAEAEKLRLVAAESREQTATVDGGDSTPADEISDPIMADSSASSKLEVLTPWIVEKPAGYIERGNDETSELMFVKPAEMSEDELDRKLANLMERLKGTANRLKLPVTSTNLMDVAINALFKHDFDPIEAIESLAKITRKSIGEPSFSVQEKENFETGVKKYGSEMYSVSKVVGTKTTEQCVRYWYMWKKTPAGQKIWSNYHGRRSKAEKAEASSDRNQAVKAGGPVVRIDDIGDSSDDSSYDNGKAVQKKKTFQCKFCNVTKSRIWRRAPGYSVGPQGANVIALCQRCAELWRRYGVQWEDPEETAKKLVDAGGRSRKRKFEEELLREQAVHTEALEAEKAERAKKKTKVAKEEEVATASGDKETPAKTKPGLKPKPEKVEEKHHCDVCRVPEQLKDLYVCARCKLSVHKQCYGVEAEVEAKNWLCDCCLNERSPEALTTYECVLCPIRDQELEGTRRKHSYGPLKRTAGSNWAHVLCAAFLPELKFANPVTYQPVEGIGSLPSTRWTAECTVCKTTSGACSECHACKAAVHVGCAVRQGWAFGFDISMVKGAGRHTATTVRFAGDSGVMTAALYCPQHDTKKISLHPINETAREQPDNALQTFSKLYKEADLTLTGCMRKAQLTSAATQTTRKKVKAKPVAPAAVSPAAKPSIKRCKKCRVDVSPMWWVEEEGDTKVVCHRCHWAITHAPPQSEDDDMDVQPAPVVEEDPEKAEMERLLAEPLPLTPFQLQAKQYAEQKAQAQAQAEAQAKLLTQMAPQAQPASHTGVPQHYAAPQYVHMPPSTPASHASHATHNGLSVPVRSVAPEQQQHAQPAVNGYHAAQPGMYQFPVHHVQYSAYSPHQQYEVHTIHDIQRVQAAQGLAALTSTAAEAQPLPVPQHYSHPGSMPPPNGTPNRQ
ncbi:putative PHD type zinc finger protein with BAH domain-containing protein [Saitoella coloradoensis]